VIKALSIELEIGTKALDVGSANHSDTVNIVDDRPDLLFGPKVDGQIDNGAIAPFYISLNIHDLILHNAMLDSGASHNLMPKAVMEKLGLEVTRPYKDLHSFYSSKVKCIGPNSGQEYGNGYSSCRHSPKVQYVTIKVMGSQDERKYVARYVLCYCSSLWTTKKTLQVNFDENNYMYACSQLDTCHVENNFGPLVPILIT
jgi:hypothetical protein